MPNKRKLFSFWAIFVPDALLLYLALWLTIMLRYGEQATSELWMKHAIVFSVIYVLWLLVLFIHGLFELPTFRRYSTLVINLVSAMAINVLVAVLYFYFQPTLILTPRRFLLLDAGIAFVLVLGWNLVVKDFLKNRLGQGVYLFSLNDELKDLEREINRHQYLGFKVLGHLCEQDLETASFAPGAGVILPDNLRARPQILAKFYEFRKSGVNFYNYRAFYEDVFRRVYLSQLNEAWFLENVNYGEKKLYNLLKRVIDLLSGALAAVVFAITFPICALLIKLSSPGPVFFIQERVGKDGKVFKVYKYRTMAGGPTDTWTSVNDPRITRVGKFMRKSRLDELPQFINLLIGNMSLVGPRPEQVGIVKDLRQQIPFYDERHLVKPGLTGWAQLNNVYAGNLDETKLKLQYDLYYIKNHSLMFDLEIILKTIYYIFTWKGR